MNLHCKKCGKDASMVKTGLLSMSIICSGCTTKEQECSCEKQPEKHILGVTS